MELINETKKTIDQITRIDGKWWGGLKPGKTIESDNPYVINALIKHGAVRVSKKQQPKPKPKIVKPTEIPKKKLEELPTPKIEYDKLTVKELKVITKENGLTVKGSKKKIIERLENAL